MEYLATFYTHYSAMRFHKYCRDSGISAKMKPVPRELSASCGVCVLFESAYAPKTAEFEDMERCYAVAPYGVYLPVKG